MSFAAPHSEGDMEMERKELLVVVLIAVLLVTTAIQTASLIGMGGGSISIGSESKSISATSSAPQQSASSSPAQKTSSASLNDLPGMVGGC
ncbi:MAG: hypothetical protein HY438_03200 [DPANN group archaeon]|nr:hypothetical protein [DPANN group archaeon]